MLDGEEAVLAMSAGYVLVASATARAMGSVTAADGALGTDSKGAILDSS